MASKSNGSFSDRSFTNPQVGFRTANGDTGLQGANMPQPQQQFQMPPVMGTFDGGGGRPMPSYMNPPTNSMSFPQSSGGLPPQMIGGPTQQVPQMSSRPMPPQMTGGPMQQNFTNPTSMTYGNGGGLFGKC